MELPFEALKHHVLEIQRAKLQTYIQEYIDFIFQDVAVSMITY